MATRQAFLQALQDPALRDVNFVYDPGHRNFEVSMREIRRLSESARNCEIPVARTNAPASFYDYANDHLHISPQGLAFSSRVSDPVHEIVHVLQDDQASPSQPIRWPIWEAEAIAYLAEVTYLVRKNRLPDTPWSQYAERFEQANFRDRIGALRADTARVAYRVGLLTHSSVSQKVVLRPHDIREMERIIYSHPVYSPGIYDFDGIRRRPSCAHAHR